MEAIQVSFTYLSRLYNFLSYLIYIRFYGGRIKGKHNKIEWSKGLIRKSKIRIIGEHNKILLNSEAKLKDAQITIRGSNNNISLSQGGTLLQANIIIDGNDNEIVIGENTIVMGPRICFKGNSNRLIIGSSCYILRPAFELVGGNCLISIGKKCIMVSGILFMAAEPHSSIKVGDGCACSVGIQVSTSDWHSIFDLETKRRINYAKSVVIGNYVWLCQGVKILKGANIGDNCVIGLGSVVSKPVESNSIAVGIPAQVVRRNITWSLELLDSLPSFPPPINMGLRKKIFDDSI